MNSSTSAHGFYEFFAGGGMARLGLGDNWRCLFANEWSPKKANSYRDYFGPSPELFVEDVRNLSSKQLPGRPMLSWASFPCQDLSLAGNGDGLKGSRSGTFWAYWDLMSEMNKEGRPVPVAVLENVVGTMTANNGDDFRAILGAMVSANYRPGAVVINAQHFVPQSRPRLFVIAVHKSVKPPPETLRDTPDDYWHSQSIWKAYENLTEDIQENWIWWNLPLPHKRVPPLSQLIEENPQGVSWHSESETRKLLSQMSDLNASKVRIAQSVEKRVVGTVYKRTRKDSNGRKVQRAEVRFDEKSGCLRTPAGGSSRQILLLVEGEKVRSRLISPREVARIMGAPDHYQLPEKYNEAYHLMGDALVPPVVSWIERHILSPIIDAMPECKVA